MTIEERETPDGSPAGESTRATVVGDSADGPTAPRRTIRRRVIAALVIIAAAGAGIAHAALSHPPSAGGSTSLAKCAAPVKAVEQVTVHADQQPAYIDLKTDITVKQGSRVARDLLALTTSASPQTVLGTTFDCYFGEFETAPTFVSAGHGLATFSDEVSGQHALGGLLPPGNWSSALHGRTLMVRFSSASVCHESGSFYAPRWGGAPLTLTVGSSVAPSALSPLPDEHSGSSYSWTFARLNCATAPSLAVSVPLSFPTYLATTVYGWTAFHGLGFFLAGWSGQIILLLLAAFFWLRYRRAYAYAEFGPRRGWWLIAVTALGFVGVVANCLPDGPLPPAAGLFGVLGLFFALALVSPARVRALTGAASAGLAALVLWYSGTLGVHAYDPSTFNIALLTEGAAAALLTAGGLCAFCRLRAIASATVGAGPGRRLPPVPDLVIFCGGTAILAAVAFSAGNGDGPPSLENHAYSTINTLQYTIPAFSGVLIAAALIIAFLPGSAAVPRGRLWWGLLGFAALAQLPDPAIGDAVIPVAEVVFAVLLAAMLAAEAPAADLSSGAGKLRTSTPCGSPPDDLRLAVQIAACLAVVPVAYFAVTAIGSIPQDSASAIFVVSGILSQFAGWLAVGVIFSMINTRLPGRYGPVRAIVFCALWFAVAFASSRVQGWLDPGAGARSWTFFGLQLLLFLVAFSAVWDARILDQRLSWASLDRLREAYNLQRARSLALYAIPLLLAIIALGQQVASGSGVEFVKSALSVVPAALGG